ncbi:MAG: hypothetical protein WD877_00125 [Candidatus Saccharimonadales bacterium]
MTTVNHAATGAAIAITINSWWALPIALVSHFILDSLPHSKLKKNEVWAEIFMATLLTVSLSLLLRDKFSGWLVFWSAFISTSPDLVWGARYFRFKQQRSKITTEQMSTFSRWHIAIQWSESRRGIIVEVIWLALMLVYIWSRYNS